MRQDIRTKMNEGITHVRMLFPAPAVHTEFYEEW